MKLEQAQADFAAQDLTILELALPAHMMFLMMEQCQAVLNLELRADVMAKLNNASIAPLSQLDMFSVQRIAKRVDETARSLLHDLSPDDPRDGLYSCAQFVLKLVDEGRLNDPTNMAVLVAILLMDDIKDDKPDVQGQEAVWRLEERRWQNAAGKLLSRAVILGLYSQPLRG